MNQRAIRAIIYKDLSVVRQSKIVLLPLILVPLLLLIILPMGIGMVLANTESDTEFVDDFRREAPMFFEQLPEQINTQLEQYDNEVQRITYIIFNMFFPAFYLMLPTMLANVIAADGFAGEKERKTLEALLYTPTTDRELYLAKLLGPWLVGVLISSLAYAGFVLVTTLTTFSLMKSIFVLNSTWLILVLWVTPAAAGLGLGAMVLISSKVNTFQEAYQLGSLIVIPLVLLLLGQLGGIIYFSPLVITGVGGVLWLFTFILIGYGAQTFKRTALIARL